MGELSIVFELDKLQEMSADISQEYHFLSETTRLLCLSLLTGWPSYRWKWTYDNEPLTDDQWDVAEAMVDQAVEEIINTMLTGMIVEFPVTTIPDGFLLCDGSEVSREDYANLFDVIGETYGNGDGSTTFNLPDRRGRVSVGLDASQSEFDTMGETGGEKSHTLIIQEMPAHDHSEGIAVSDVVNGGLEAPAPVALPSTGTTGSAGGDQAHNNLQPYQVTNFIIKT